jgi:hypothetical protein
MYATIMSLNYLFRFPVYSIIKHFNYLIKTLATIFGSTRFTMLKSIITVL